jgi:hypothetical protein
MRDLSCGFLPLLKVEHPVPLPTLPHLNSHPLTTLLDLVELLVTLLDNPWAHMEALVEPEVLQPYPRSLSVDLPLATLI